VFGQATHSAAFFAQQPIDGLCGMAFTSLAVDGVVPPFINLMDSLAMPVFTVWMTACVMRREFIFHISAI
jgi:hypothetical protein